MTNNIHAKVENVAGGIKFTISRPHETWYEPSAGGGFGVILIYRQEVGGASALRCEYSPDPSATTAEVFWPLCDAGTRYVYDVQIEPINPRNYREYIRHEMLSITPDDGGGEETITYSGGTSLSVTASFVAEKPKIVITDPPMSATGDSRVESYQMEVHYNAGQDWGQTDTEWMTCYSCAPTSLVHIDPYDGTGTDFRTMLASFGHDRFFSEVKFVFTIDSCPGQKWAHKVAGSNCVVVGPAGSAVTLATPLTLEAAVAGAVVTFDNKATGPVSYTVNGGTGGTIASGESKAITLSAVGDTVEFFGDNEKYGAAGNENSSTISCTKDCYVYGNVMSLISSSGYESANMFTDTYAFAYLFVGNTKIKNKSGYDLLLPATSLNDWCYQGMFHSCTSLTTAPELPSTTLSRNCYFAMFHGCTSLTTAPELPATTLADSCYYYMFWGCTSLTTAPELPATTLASSCYYGMFNGCTSLTTAPSLSATTLADYCCSSMFNAGRLLLFKHVQWLFKPYIGARTSCDNAGRLLLFKHVQWLFKPYIGARTSCDNAGKSLLYQYVQWLYKPYSSARTSCDNAGKLLLYQYVLWLYKP